MTAPHCADCVIALRRGMDRGGVSPMTSATESVHGSFEEAGDLPVSLGQCNQFPSILAGQIQLVPHIPDCIGIRILLDHILPFLNRDEPPLPNIVTRRP